MYFVGVVRRLELTDGTEYVDVRPIDNDDDLADAMGKGQSVWVAKDDGLSLDRELFDGARWLSNERPVFPEVGEKLDLPSTPYVDQRVELALAQMDAMTAVLVEIAPANPSVRSLVARSADVRAAVEFDDEATMDELIAEFRSEGVSASVAGAGQVAGGSKFEAAGGVSKVTGQGQGGA